MGNEEKPINCGRSRGRNVMQSYEMKGNLARRDFTILDPIQDGRQRNSHRGQRYIRGASEL